MVNEGMAPGFGSRTTDVAVRMLNKDGRKQSGNAASIGCGQLRVVLSLLEIRVPAYKE